MLWLAGLRAIFFTVTLIWDAPVMVGNPLQDVAQYIVYKQMNGGLFQDYWTIPAILTGFTDASVGLGTNCYYVTAENAAEQETIPSNTVCVTCTRKHGCR